MSLIIDGKKVRKILRSAGKVNDSSGLVLPLKIHPWEKFYAKRLCRTVMRETSKPAVFEMTYDDYITMRHAFYNGYLKGATSSEVILYAIMTQGDDYSVDNWVCLGCMEKDTQCECDKGLYIVSSASVKYKWIVEYGTLRNREWMYPKYAIKVNFKRFIRKFRRA